MNKEFRKLIAVLLLTLMVSCSIILVSKSTDTTINQQLNEDLKLDANLNIKKDTLKHKKQ